MDRRVELQQKLEGIVGSGRVYFQPPESVKMVYPCLVYQLNDFEAKSAGNEKYIVDRRYTLTYITRNPDDATVERILELPMCSYDRYFSSANLHHHTYTLFY